MPDALPDAMPAPSRADAGRPAALTDPLGPPIGITPSAPCRPLIVIGAGALGGHVAARLARAGVAVALLARPVQARAIEASGLCLVEAGRAQAITVSVFDRIDALPWAAARAVLVCVKSGDTATTARALAPWLPPGVPVLSLQNGVDNARALAEALPDAPLLVGLAYLAAASPRPGVVEHHGGGTLVLAPATPMAENPAENEAENKAEPARPGAPHPVPAALADLGTALTAAGYTVQTVADARPALWRKLLVNGCCNAVSALAQADYAQMAALAPVRELLDALLDEGLAVARAEGVALDADELRAAVARIAQTMPQQRSSTAQDLARGRPSEIDHLNGHLVARGRALGVPTPSHRAVWALVRLVESVQAATRPAHAAAHAAAPAR
ncbi:MAG: hypothetical protein RL223_4150 [Pseudomonadota bacterium]